MLFRLKKLVLHFIGDTVWFKNYSLTTKFFVFSAVLITTPVLIMGAISYIRSVSILEDVVREYRWELNEQVKMQVEYYLRDVETSALKIVNHPDMKQFLEEYDQGEYFSEHSRDDIRTLLLNTAYSRPDISSVAIVIDKDLVFDSLGYRGQYNFEEVRQSYWYTSVPNDGSSMLISRFIKVKDEKQPVITIAKRLYSPHTLLPVGMLLIDVNYRRLQEIADEVNNRSSTSFFILDAKGHYVYHQDNAMIGQDSPLADLEHIMTFDGKSFLREAVGEIVLTHSNALDWRFGSVIPWAEVSKGSSHLALTIMLTIVFCLLVAYIVGASFASTIIRPVRRLKTFMKKVQTGNFCESVVVEAQDEIGQLTQGFNQMTQKLSDLIEEVYLAKLKETEMSLQQKEMELKVLQSQINPHFLCNSLETIRGMALMEGKEDIAVMSASLGTLLRYNLKNVSPTVPLREEIEYCKVYLRIQQFRFEKNMEFCFSLPEWTMDSLIVKFSLQPLVENCFIHGVGNGTRLTRIEIMAWRENNDMVIKISDNGVGMSEETLARIQDDLLNKDITAGGEHIGIVNVHRRIVNLFGLDYGLSLNSSCMGGTSVYIRLPIIKKDKEDQM